MKKTKNWIHPGLRYSEEMKKYGKFYYGFNKDKPVKKTKLNADR